MVNKWSTGLLRRYPPTKWHRKALLNCSKLLMNEVGNFMNHSLATPLRVVGKERHSISSRGCWRPNVVLKGLRWSLGSLISSNGSSWGNLNFNGTEHSRTAVVKDEFVALTILSRLWSAFSLMAFLNLSISFLISRIRSKFCSSGVMGPRRSLLRWLSPLSSWLALDRFSSCWSHSLISWFCLVSSSTVVTRAWTCWAKAAESWLDSIWIWELIRNCAFEPEYENVSFPTDDAKLMKYKFVNRSECIQMESNPWLWKWWNNSFKMVINAVLATTSPMPESVWGKFLQKNKQYNNEYFWKCLCNSCRCWGGGVIYIHSLVSSRCDYYGGFNASFGNTSWSMIWALMGFQRSI